MLFSLKLICCKKFEAFFKLSNYRNPLKLYVVCMFAADGYQPTTPIPTTRNPTKSSYSWADTLY